MKITELRVAGIGPYKKKAVLPIGPGVTVLCGANHIKGGNGNAVGKTLIGSVVSEIVWGPQVRADQLKVGLMGFTMIKDGHTYEVDRVSNKTKIQRDGKDISYRTETGTRKILSSLIPLTDSEYNTYGMIGQSHVLVKGTDKQRRDFFNEFFRLEELEHEKKAVMAYRTKSKASLEAYEEARSELVPYIDLTELKARVETLSKKMVRASAINERAARWEALSEARAACPDWASYDLSKIDRKIKALESQERAWQAYQLDRQAYARYVKQKAAYEELVGDTDVEALRVKTKAVAKARAWLADQPKKPLPVERPKQVRYDLKTCLAAVGRLEHQLTHLRRNDGRRCYACGQPVDLDPKTVKADLERWTARLDAATEADAKAKEWATYQKELAAWSAVSDRVKRAEALVKKGQDLEDQLEIVMSTPRPERVAKPSPVEDPGPELESLRKIQAYRGILEVDVEPTSYVDVQDIQNQLSGALNELAVAEASNSRRKAVVTKLKALKPAVADKQYTDLLVEAYSDKAMKRMIIDAVLERLTSTVADLASSVLDYRFEFRWRTTVEILVHRPGGATTDVRRLSGAESKLFHIVLVMALMSFVPAQKRLDLLIMDEPTASMHWKSVESFVKLLPRMLKTWDRILIITPEDINVPRAEYYRVERTARGSSVVHLRDFNMVTNRAGAGAQ